MSRLDGDAEERQSDQCGDRIRRLMDRRKLLIETIGATCQTWTLVTAASS